MEPSKPLSLPQDPPIVGCLRNGTAFFVNQSGYMLTARHAVDHCARIVIATEQHRTQARIVALSAKYDLALAQFAKLVKYRLEEWLGADDATAARFRVYLKAHAGASDGPPPTLIVQAWVSQDGSVERVLFPALGDAGAIQDLRTTYRAAISANARRPRCCSRSGCALASLRRGRSGRPVI